MKKNLLSVFAFLFFVTTVSAQLVKPEGYTSIYDLNFETEQCPSEVKAAASYQFVGPGQGWGDLANYDLSTYKQLVFGFTYEAANAGKQIAIRFSVNGAPGASKPAIIVIVTLPEGSTSHVVSIPLEQYKNEAGAIGLGGIIVYNGVAHWSFTYDGTPSASSIFAEFIALTDIAPSTGLTDVRAENPNAIVNVYSISGSLIRENVKFIDATNSLNPGLYIINNKKVFVTK